MPKDGLKEETFRNSSAKLRLSAVQEPETGNRERKILLWVPGLWESEAARSVKRLRSSAVKNMGDVRYELARSRLPCRTNRVS